MKINNFYKTPSKIGENSIVKELSEKFGTKQGESFIFKTDDFFNDL
jgi:hypothetical protein